MVTIKEIQNAMEALGAYTPGSKMKLSQVALSLQIYQDRGEFDGTLVSAQRCLHWASYEVEGFPFAKRITKKAANAVSTRQELKALYEAAGCVDVREVQGEHLPEGTNAHYAALALELGASVRDNTLPELVAIGKDIALNGFSEYE